MTSNIMVTDFGQAYHVTHPPDDDGIPYQYVAPEVAIPGVLRLGFPADIWALGATLCEVRQGSIPFELLSHDQIGYCQRLEEVLGLLPEPYRCFMRLNPWVRQQGLWWNDLDKPISMKPEELNWRREKRRENFGYKDVLQQVVVEPRGKWVWREGTPDFGHNRHIGTLEARDLHNLLVGIFKYDPAERPTIAQIRDHSWFLSFCPAPRRNRVHEDGIKTEGPGHEGSNSSVFLDTDGNASTPSIMIKQSVEDGGAEADDTFMDHDDVAATGKLVEGAVTQGHDVLKNQPRNTVLHNLHEAGCRVSCRYTSFDTSFGK